MLFDPLDMPSKHKELVHKKKYVHRKTGAIYSKATFRFIHQGVTVSELCVSKAFAFTLFFLKSIHIQGDSE